MQLLIHISLFCFFLFLFCIPEDNWMFIAFVPYAIFAVDRLFFRWYRLSRITTLTHEQSIGGLLALLRIRSAQVGAMYHSIRECQRNAGNAPWIPLFIAEYRSTSNYNAFEETCIKKEKKDLEKAEAIYKKRFYYDPFFGLNESGLTDISIAMLYWTSSPDWTIRLLGSIRCDANLSQHVYALLKQYRLIQVLTLGGNFHILFRNWYPLSSLMRERYRLLCHHWEEVLRSHHCALLTMLAMDPLGHAPYVLNEVMAEIQALAIMESHLLGIMSQENTKSHSRGPNKKEELAFFQYLKSNPIWMKFYGYELISTDEAVSKTNS